MMRIAVIVGSVPDIGGGFQQQLSTAVLLNKHQGKHEFIFYTTVRENSGILKSHGIQAKYLDTRDINNALRPRLTKRQRLYRFLGALHLVQDPVEKCFLRDNIDLIYFLGPSSLALSIPRFNYVMTVWDLCHRDHAEFLEVGSSDVFDEREHFYRNALPRAVAVLVDSDLGKQNIIRRYGCDESRVSVAQFLPSVSLTASSGIDVRKKYSLGKPYVFYPAQFWAHKNHVYVLDGLNVLHKKYGIDVDAVFSGSDKGNLSYVLEYARSLNLERSVHYVGFVPSEEMASFYKQAVALVMPTYFGPTNIPPLEAFALGCPVCYSDLPGLRDQVKDAAFLMDLDDPASMARHVMTILNDLDAIQKRVEKGKQLLAQWTEEDYWNVLSGILERYARKMRCWKDI